MKTKINFFALAFSLLLFSYTPSIQAADRAPKLTAIAEKPESNQEAKALVQRLMQIQEMDKSSLSNKEKRALRKEVKAMQQKASVHNGGLYISTGALIIIIILLIILL